MFTKKIAVRIGALVLVAVTGSGLVAIESGSTTGAVVADLNKPCC